MEGGLPILPLYLDPAIPVAHWMCPLCESKKNPPFACLTGLLSQSTERIVINPASKPDKLPSLETGQGRSTADMNRLSLLFSVDSLTAALAQGTAPLWASVSSSVKWAVMSRK